MQDAISVVYSAATMKLPTQMFLIVIFFHVFITQSLEFEEDQKEVDPLHFDYDVTSQTMKKDGKNAYAIQLEECKKNLKTEQNIREEVQLSLQECKKNLKTEQNIREEVQLSLQDCSSKSETLQDEKLQLESIVQEQKISQQEQKDATSACELQNQNLKQDTQSLKSEVEMWKEEVEKRKKDTTSLKYEVEKLEEEVAYWKKLLIVLSTLAMGAISVGVVILRRATHPHVGVPDQQDDAHRQGPPHQGNDPDQQDPAPLQNIPEEHQRDDDQHNGGGPLGGSDRQINPMHPSDEGGATSLVGTIDDVEEIPPRDGSLHGQMNMGDQCDAVGSSSLVGNTGEVREGSPVGEVYQTATNNSEYESSLPVQPMSN